MSNDSQRHKRVAAISKSVESIEWPTIGLFILIHGLWLATTFWWVRLPWPALAVAGGWIVAWHGSLQHEVIHGHPTPWRRLNAALASAPLSLWMPLGLYRRSHLDHHAAEVLTDPVHDPESRYLTRGAGLGYEVRKRLASLQAPLLGRLLLGPVVEIAAFLASQIRALLGGDRVVRRAWVLHAISLAPVILWLHFVCHLSLARYGVCFVYPGTALTLLRSYAEHRSAPTPSIRVAVVERAPMLGLLFLNNNLHAAHHAWPGAPWYELAGLYHRHRTALLAANGGLVYDGYTDVVRRFLFRAHDQITYDPSPEGAGQQAA
jgi:fatty acid desaturase